jgi:hypothetical protein
MKTYSPVKSLLIALLHRSPEQCGTYKPVLTTSAKLRDRPVPWSDLDKVDVYKRLSSVRGKPRQIRRGLRDHNAFPPLLAHNGETRGCEKTELRRFIRPIPM